MCLDTEQARATPAIRMPADAARIKDLEDALRAVRQAIVEKADDTFWLSEIETVVDRIDGVLGGYADTQTELSI